MKVLVTLTPETASSRIRPAVSAARDRSERRGSDISYFPGCRKDTNCHCDICLASIDATRDLIPSGGSIRTSVTKLSVSRPTPSPFVAGSPPTSPETGSTVTPPSTPVIESRTRSRPAAKAVAKKEESWGLSCRAVRILVGLFLLWAADMGLSAVIMKDFSSKLTPEVVSRAGEECRVLGNDLKGILQLLQQRMGKLVGGRASNCSSVDSFWEMNPVFSHILESCFLLSTYTTPSFLDMNPLQKILTFHNSKLCSLNCPLNNSTYHNTKGFRFLSCVLLIEVTTLHYCRLVKL